MDRIEMSVIMMIMMMVIVSVVKVVCVLMPMIMVMITMIAAIGTMIVVIGNGFHLGEIKTVLVEQGRNGDPRALGAFDLSHRIEAA